MSHNPLFYLLHGDNQLTSRQKLGDLLNQAKNQQKEIVRIEGKTTSLTEIKQALESQSLFGQEKLIILEDLFSRQKSKEKEEIIKYLKTNEFSSDLIVWEPKEIDGRSLKSFSGNWQIFLSKTPAIIFKLLDSFRPGNTKQILTLLLANYRTGTPEVIFYMLTSRIRQLIMAFDLGKEGLKGAPWQIGKLISQAKKFSLEQLISIYKHLLEIDIDIKTGRSLMPLAWHLDLLVSCL